MSEDIHRRLSDLDEYNQLKSHESELGDQDEANATDSTTTALVTETSSPNLKIKIGSKQSPPQPFHVVETAHQEDNAFTNFRIKLNKFLNDFFHAFDIPLPDGKQIQLRERDEVCLSDSPSSFITLY